MSTPPFTTADKVVFERLAQMEIRRTEVHLEVRFSPEADAEPLERPNGASNADTPPSPRGRAD
jgi:hypothetical protein